MKKIQITLATIICLFVCTANTYAQGWNQDRGGIYSIGVGGTNVIAIGNGYSHLSGAGLSMNVSGEYRVARFVGLGFETGMDLFFNPYYYAPRYQPSNVQIGIPIGLKVNIHILEAARVAIADRLDVYAGLNLGGGPAFYTGGPGPNVYGFIEVGPQIGIRYWFNHNIAIFGEFGWGATFANIGVTL